MDETPWIPEQKLTELQKELKLRGLKALALFILGLGALTGSLLAVFQGAGAFIALSLLFAYLGVTGLFHRELREWLEARELFRSLLVAQESEISSETAILLGEIELELYDR